METNKAIAYNNVIITDPKSTMKAGIVEFDLKTKNININPESAIQNIKVVNKLMALIKKFRIKSFKEKKLY